jgi:CheY-like chemotaxis protein
MSVATELAASPRGRFARSQPAGVDDVERRPVNLLVVEDDPADACLILEALGRHPDVGEARAMDNPEAALDMLTAGVVQPDAILVDIHMPKISGFEFVERLRRIREMTDTPVAFLTTSRLESNVDVARAISAYYVVKPDTFADLNVRLDVVIKRILSGAWSSK